MNQAPVGVLPLSGFDPSRKYCASATLRLAGLCPDLPVRGLLTDRRRFAVRATSRQGRQNPSLSASPHLNPTGFPLGVLKHTPLEPATHDGTGQRPKEALPCCTHELNRRRRSVRNARGERGTRLRPGAVTAKPRVSLPPRTDCSPPGRPPGGQARAITNSFPVMEGTSPSFTAKQQIRSHVLRPVTTDVNFTTAAQEPVKRSCDPPTWANPHQRRVCVTPHCRDPARLLDRTLRRLVMGEEKNQSSGWF